MEEFSDIIYNESIKRNIFLKRNKSFLMQSIEDELRLHDLDFMDRIESSLFRLSEKDFKKLATASSFDTDRLKSFSSSLISFSKSSESFVNNFINKSLDRLVVDEFQFQINLIAIALKKTNVIIPKLKQLNKKELLEYRKLEPMFNTTQKDFVKKWSEGRSEKILKRIRRDIRRGKNKSEVLRAIRGTEKRFSGIVKDTCWGAKLALSTLHVSATSAAAKAFIDVNDSFELVVSANLESSSAKVCVVNHNKVITDFRPPFHLNCNTRTILKLKSLKPYRKETIVSWWENQDDEAKIEFLGKKRFEIYQSNQSKFKDPTNFISNYGDIYTLDKLSSMGFAP